MQTTADAQVEQLLAELQSEQLPNGLCLYDPGWHQGVVGLVAGRIKDAVQRPVIAFAPAADESAETAELKGSARSVEGIHIRDVLALLDTRYPNLMTRFGWHAMAAGLTLPQQKLAAFQQAWGGGTGGTNSAGSGVVFRRCATA